MNTEPLQLSDERAEQLTYIEGYLAGTRHGYEAGYAQGREDQADEVWARYAARPVTRERNPKTHAGLDRLRYPPDGRHSQIDHRFDHLYRRFWGAAYSRIARHYWGYDPDDYEDGPR